jgi:hypothetical protein
MSRVQAEHAPVAAQNMAKQEAQARREAQAQRMVRREAQAQREAHTHSIAMEAMECVCVCVCVCVYGCALCVVG